jgi:hypothetical protein
LKRLLITEKSEQAQADAAMAAWWQTQAANEPKCKRQEGGAVETLVTRRPRTDPTDI